MIISEKGIKFIANWEEFRCLAYQDQAGIWTIGYGTIRYHDGTKVKQGDKMTKTEAKTYLIADVDGMSVKINIFIQASINQHQFDALTSMTYNIGTQGLKTSTLLKRLNSGQFVQEDHFTRWNKITKDGKLVASSGLTRRRKSEWKLFNEGDYKGNS